MSMTPTRHATVATIVVADASGILEDTVAAVGRQVYEASEPAIVGGEGDSARTLAEAVEALDRSIQYVWVVREGAVPLPDALSALVADADRTGAGIVGSKIVGTDRVLESVGLVTDAFDVPYTGLDDSELDQGQYDVVRDVAAVAGVSMLVRRDLLHGLGGVDERLAPLAASVDLAQRARLKGARIVVSPASEVTYDWPDPGRKRWREDASRIRGYTKVYGWLTLLWVVPLDFLIGIVEAIVSLFFGKWLVIDFFRVWGWNIGVFPSTYGARRKARAKRSASEAELFRFQRRGSVKISGLASRTMSSMRRRLPGDDTLTVESIGRDVRQPAFIVGALAVLFVLVSARSIWSDGLPAVGYTMPFPSNGWDALAGYAGGWNPAGLGSELALRPLLGIAGIAKVVTLHSGHLAEYLLGAGAMLFGIWGVMRLLRTWSIGAAPGLLAGVVFVAGPTAQGLAGNTHIGTLLALGALPWAIRACVAPLREGFRPAIGRVAGVVLWFGLLGALAPLLLLVPLPAIFLLALLRFKDSGLWKATILAMVGTAGGALLLSPFIWEHSFEAIARAGYAYWSISPVLAVAGVVIGAAAVFGSDRVLGLIAGWGAALAAIGFFVSRGGSFGFGTEAESAGLAVAGLGLAVLIGVTAESVTNPELASWKRVLTGVGSVAVVFFLVSAMVIVLGGRLGLPGDVYVSTLSFTMANEGEAERSRVLIVGPEHLMPGDSRDIQGGAYRVVSAPAPDLGEPRLAPRGALDDALYVQLERVIAGETRRAGAELAAFGVRWIVVMGDSEGTDGDPASLAWRDVFAGQLDLLPLSAGVENAVFVTDIDPVGRALTSTAASWPREGWTYAGPLEFGKRVFVAENPSPNFGPEPWQETASANEVSSGTGVVTYSAESGPRTQTIVVALSVILLVALVFVGRRRT
ncbi:MAG: hypothetical protein ACR2N2_00125 [Acidimicrobiia bacterium]